MSVLKIRNATTGAFESVPAVESSVIVADGSVTEEKLAPDVLEMIEAAAHSSTIKMSNIVKAGQIFVKPGGLPYCGWPFNDVQYDPETNEIVFLINAAVQHGDDANTHLWMGKINLDTYEVTIKEIGNPSTLGHGFYCMGFCIDSDGNYWYIDAKSKMLGFSDDKGDTWTETSVSSANNWPESITQLSNGRFLFWGDGGTPGHGVWYSDNDCETWTRATMSDPYYEGFFLELPDDDGTYTGKVMCFMRKSTNGTSNGAWNGTKIQEGICLSLSENYGTTWTSGAESTTLREGCANIATAFYHKDEDLVEVFTSPRYPYGDTYGAVFQYITTRKDALQDKFGTPKVVAYAKAKAYQDFGHIGGCFDRDGDMHLMYYDGDASSPGSVNYYYMKASRNQSVMPLNSSGISSLFLPYSASQADANVAALRKELMKKINEIIIHEGGDPDDPDFYVTDELVLDLDFTDPSKVNLETNKIKDTFGAEFAGTFNENKQLAADFSMPASTLQSLVTDKTQFTIELCDYVNSARDGTQNDYIIYFENEYYGLLRGRQNFYRWTDTQSSTHSTYADNHGSITNLHNKTGKTQIVLVCDSTGVVKTYKNKSLLATYTCSDFASYANQFGQKWMLNYTSLFTFLTFRVYNKALTETEIAQNYNYLVG